MGRLIKALIFGAVLLAFGLFVGLGFLFIVSGGDVVGLLRESSLRLALLGREDELNAPAGTDATPQRFNVALGDSTAAIAARLAEAGLINDAELFITYTRLQGLDRQLEAGVYFLNPTLAIPDIALRLTDASSSHIPFLLLEGARMEEIAAQIDANGLFNFDGAAFLEALSQPPPDFAEWVGLPLGASLEGFLFPDRYQLPPETTPEALREALLDHFERYVGVQRAQQAAAQGLTLYEVVTLASIVEREAVWNDEKPLIASVYLNRLDAGMRLQADPTVQYGLDGSRGRWWPQIAIADYQSVQSPYNTYLVNGLPPGPIASPSLAAIDAVLNPEASDYFFFRARCDGSNYHNFAEDFDAHLANACR